MSYRLRRLLFSLVGSGRRQLTSVLDSVKAVDGFYHLDKAIASIDGANKVHGLAYPSDYTEGIGLVAMSSHTIIQREESGRLTVNSSAKP